MLSPEKSAVLVLLKFEGDFHFALGAVAQRAFRPRSLTRVLVTAFGAFPLDSLFAVVKLVLS